MLEDKINFLSSIWFYEVVDLSFGVGAFVDLHLSF